MIPFRKSVGFRLLGISFILLALPLLVDSFILFQKSYKHSIKDAKNYLAASSRLREPSLSNIQPVNLPFIHLIIQYLNLKENFPDKPSDELDQKLDKLAEVGEISRIYLLKINEDGRYIVVAGPQELIGKDYTEFFRLKNLFSKSAEQKGYVPYISFNNENLEPYFILAHPVVSEQTEEVLGILAISDNISDQLNALLKPDSHEFPVNFALILPSSIILSASDPDLRFNYLKPLNPKFKDLFDKVEPLAAKKLAKEPLNVISIKNSSYLEFDWKGEKQIGHLIKVPNRQYSLLTYASKNEIFKVPFVNYFNIYTAYILILIFGGLIAYLLTKRMAKPMQNLSIVMTGIQKGDLSLRYKPDPLGFEINILGQIFNETVDSLLEKKQIVQEERIKKETLARELKLGRDVQMSLLPDTMPKIQGIDLAEIYIPAIQVGGDFYDVYTKKSDGAEKLVLAVADASGKGVRACLYSLGVRNMLRIFSKEFENPAKAMAMTNNLFCVDTGDTGMFVTVIMGVYDPQTKLLSYSSCGHNPAILRKANGTTKFLDHLGMAMGVIPAEVNPPSNTTKLEKGDLLVFYTDGVTEAHDESFNQYGEKRLSKYLEKEGWKSSSDVVKGIVEEISQFAGKAPQHDDITLLAMKVVE